MAQLLADIPWGESLLPPVEDPAWEAEIKRRGGQVAEVDRRVAPNSWLRETCLGLTTYRPVAIPDRLIHIGALVTAQENSCRYCYGANRAYLKILGYSESFIGRIERDAHLAELDDKERAFISFCRNLARSRPRPSGADRDALVRLGYSQPAVHEMALVISLGCFYNRIGLLMACPPEEGFERMANGIIGRVIGMAAPLMRALSARRRRGASAPAPEPAALTAGPFGPILAPLAGLPGAAVVKGALDGAFASAALPRRTKALMFAVVARTLGSRLCEDEARRLLAGEGFAGSDVESALATLNSNRLPADEARMLPWVRGTVHYQVAAIQEQTRALAAAIGPAMLLEAIGVASLSNATVRLAMLAE